MEIEELKHIIRDAGIAGAGGAGFPAYGKVNGNIKTIILNCAECEPLLKVHRQLLKKYSYEIISALHMLSEVMRASDVYIALKGSYKDTVLSVKGVLSAFPDIDLKLLPEVYPMGDEAVLIYETTGYALPAGAIPASAGIAVFNVETVFNIYRAVWNSSAVTHKYLTIAGEVSKPVTVKVPIGMEIQEAVKAAGEITCKDNVYLMGGPMTGHIAEGYETVQKTTNAILVLSENHYVIKKKRGKNSIHMKRAMASCCQCSMCTDLCPRHLLGHPVKPHEFMHSATSGITRNTAPFMGTLYCSGCGLCEMYSCVQELSPRSLMEDYKNGLKSKGIKVPVMESTVVSRFREYRGVPMDRLVNRLNLAKYNISAPIDEEIIHADSVRIKLCQHIGAAAVPTVKKGDKVTAGQLIGTSQKDQLGLPVHASITGTVIEISDDAVWLKA